MCGGLARYLEADPVIVRLAFVASIFIPPFAAAALIGYLAGWLIIPLEPEPASPDAGMPPEGTVSLEGPPPAAGVSLPPDASLVGGILFVAVGVLFLLLNLGLLPWDILRFWRWRVLWPVVVIALGVLMLVRSFKIGGARSDAR